MKGERSDALIQDRGKKEFDIGKRVKRDRGCSVGHGVSLADSVSPAPGWAVQHKMSDYWTFIYTQRPFVGMYISDEQTVSRKYP